MKSQTTCSVVDRSSSLRAPDADFGQIFLKRLARFLAEDCAEMAGAEIHLAGDFVQREVGIHVVLIDVVVDLLKHQAVLVVCLASRDR